MHEDPLAFPYRICRGFLLISTITYCVRLWLPHASVPLDLSRRNPIPRWKNSTCRQLYPKFHRGDHFMQIVSNFGRIIRTCLRWCIVFTIITAIGLLIVGAHPFAQTSLSSPHGYSHNMADDPTPTPTPPRPPCVGGNGTPCGG